MDNLREYLRESFENIASNFKDLFRRVQQLEMDMGSDAAGGGTFSGSHDDLSDVSSGDHHDPITLDSAELRAILDLTGQALTLDDQNANLVLASPDGSNGQPAFRALVSDDLPAGLGDMTKSVYDTDDDGDVDASAGGTGIDTSGDTGVATVSAGTWSILAQLTAALGGTGIDSSGSTGIPHVDAGTWSILRRLKPTEDSEITINAGAITVTRFYHRVDTEADSASDDLDTISGLANDGELLIVHPENDARTVVLKHGTGNIYIPGGSDITMDEYEYHVLLIYDAESSSWCVLGAGGGGGTGTDELVKVSADDTTAGYLLAKLAAGTGITLTETNGGGDEDVTIGFDGDASEVTYTPTTLTDWDGDTDPGDVDDALDQLAERIDDVEDGASKDVFVATAAATVANTTSETTLFGSGEGSLTLAADYFTAGRSLRIHMRGQLGDTGTPTLNIKVKLGTTTIAETTATTLTGVTDVEWMLDILLTCRSAGASGSFIAGGLFDYDDGSEISLSSGTAVTVDTTASLALDVTVTWGTADASNTITCQEAIAEMVDPNAAEAGGGGGGGTDPVFHIEGTLATATEVGGAWIAPRAATIQYVYVYCADPGSASSTIADVNKNGTTIFTTQANRPELAYDDADQVAKSGVPDVTALDENDVLTIDIDQVGTGAESLTVIVALSLDNDINNLACQGRLTLTSGTPVTTSDVTGATTLYFAPYKGNQVALYDGSNWSLHDLTEISIAIPATTDTNYDAFIYDSSGTLTLELTAWTDATNRATALTTQDGVYVKSGSTTRRYLGTIRTTGVSGECEDSVAARFVWNYYNRVPRKAWKRDVTAHSYSTNAWRYFDNDSSNYFEYVCGVVEDDIWIAITARMDSGMAAIYLVLDGTTFDYDTLDVLTTLGDQIKTGSGYTTPSLGYHFYALFERAYSGSSNFSVCFGQMMIRG